MRRLRYLFTTLHLYTSVQRRFNSLIIILYNILYNIIFIILTTKTYFKKLYLQLGIFYISHRNYFNFLMLFWKYGFRSFIINGRTDFCLDFINFRDFSGPYDGHTYSPPLKKYGNGRTDPVVLKKAWMDTD